MAGHGARGAAPTIDSIFRANATHRPDMDALIDPPDRESVTGQMPRRLTYAEADRAIDAIAARLRQIGLPTGTVVGLQIPNVVESILALLAITRAGMVPAPLPLLWRRADCVAALSHAGARAMITCGRVGDTDHAQLALEIAAELFPIRVVCGFGCGRVDGIVPFDDCLRAESAPAATESSLHVDASPGAIITFDMTAAGPVSVLRDHAQLLAGGMLVQHRAAIEPRSVIVSTIPAASFGGLTATLLSWLLSGGTLALHHPFDPELLADQMTAHGGHVLVVPEALLSALTQSDLFDAHPSVRTVIALWRSPERVAGSSQWPDGAPHLVDVVAFGEAGLLAETRPASGRAAPWPLGNVVITNNGEPVTLGRVTQTTAGTLALAGALAASPLRFYDFEPVDPFEVDTDIIDTGFACRLTDDRMLVVTAPPADLINVGGYRFAMHDLQSRIHAIESNGVLAAFPHAVCGYRLAGHALNSEALRAKLEETGMNPLIKNAFHQHLPS